MFLEFTVENFRSFYERRTMTMLSKKISEGASENVCKDLSYSVLKSLAVYGANSSGKTNLIVAMQWMKYCVLTSVKLNPNDSLQHDPFLLVKNNTKPTLFEVSFLKGGFCYRYGFSYNKAEIIDEWLFRKTTVRSKEQALFIRNQDGIAFGDKEFPEGIGLESKINNNRLFLSLCAQLGGEISMQVISWFDTGINIVSGLNNQDYRLFSTLQFHQGEEISKQALFFFKTLRLGFDNISTRIVELSGKKQIEVESVHNLYDGKGKVCGSVNFEFDDKESSGTRKLFDISGPVFDTLEKGTVLVIDELDAKMHPLISQEIIKLFNGKKTNPNNAQLIFSTHDTHLLSTKMLRRDQIWFTEKNDAEQSDLYCLSDIVLPDGSKLRNDANYEKNYIAGRYGAIPFIINE